MIIYFYNLFCLNNSTVFVNFCLQKQNPVRRGQYRHLPGAPEHQTECAAAALLSDCLCADTLQQGKEEC